MIHISFLIVFLFLFYKCNSIPPNITYSYQKKAAVIHHSPKRLKHYKRKTVKRRFWIISYRPHQFINPPSIIAGWWPLSETKAISFQHSYGRILVWGIESDTTFTNRTTNNVLMCVKFFIMLDFYCFLYRKDRSFQAGNNKKHLSSTIA